MPIVTEIVSTEHVDLLREYADVLQIGARNMQNFELLKKVGALGKPVLLKRGLAATIQDLLMSAEYLLAHGTEQVILCERGIRTFETATRNTLDISAVPVVKKLSHLPIFIDPSHAVGLREKVPSMALAAVAGGAHGITVEVHPDPDRALSDGPQSLFPEQFYKLMRDIEVLASVLEKEVARLPRIEDDRARPHTSPEAAVRTKPSVAYRGVRGSFSEKAVFLHFGEDVDPTALPEFEDVFNAVLEDRARFGMIPIENTRLGSIHRNYDLLLRFPDIAVVGEQKSRTDGFCIETKDVGIEESGVPDIETAPLDYTRFVVIAKEGPDEIEDPNRVSIVFAAANKPGALFFALEVLARRSINMTKLESRPILGKPWEYRFYLDLDLPADPAAFEDALIELRKHTEELRVLGRYRV